MSKQNPINKSDREVQRVEPELESDRLSPEASKKAVDIVLTDYEAGIKSMEEWKERKKLSLWHYVGEKPSMIENLNKEDWQSDRNLNLGAAVADIYQATLLSTCYNPDSIHYVATEVNDIDNKTNLEKFTKWGLENEAKAFSEVDDFIHNRIVYGFSCFYIYWKVWYEWVDRRIPKKTGGYTIKTERVRFEKGVLENIADVDDIIVPEFGKKLQELPWFIHVLHKTGEDLLDEGNRKIFNNIDEKFIEKLRGVCLDAKRDGLSVEKAKQLGINISEASDADLRIFPIDLLQWFGNFTVKGRTEKYRFIVEPTTRTLLSAKPLRKITRTGKIPYVGGSFIRIPGKIRGRSLLELIAPILNAINNVYNQKSDFQYFQNCPFGFYSPDENNTTQELKIKPGKLYPVAGNPQEGVYMPNLSRSMAWAYQDINLLFEILEKLTGAASYFMTNERNTSGTATRDMIVSEKGETKFSLWVKRIMEDLNEAITMWTNMYQDWAPPKLGERVLGKEGKQLIRNLSIESLRGNYDARMTPDILSGSKALEKQVQMWLFTNLQNSIWLHPQVNPRGNWNLFADTMKIMGRTDIERYLPPEPKMDMGKSEEVENEWARFIQGESFPPPKGENTMEHLIGHMQQKADKYFDLDPEYRPNFDQHVFETQVELRNLINAMRQEQMVSTLSMQMIKERQMGMNPEAAPMPPQPAPVPEQNPGIPAMPEQGVING